ncbi:hypothetical protein [Burkholderia sp. BCC1047]|uniref:hypothetical protein n=1 Tax=Burkholderia sp. BCC1047 TaxID=2676299 RepID=UPI001FC885D9|nr:hypothetical protein [Burkholderia sp. BCC1047]
MIDLENAREAARRKQVGMVILYRINAAAEIYVGFYSAAAGINLIFRLGFVFANFNPIVFGLTAIILTVSVVIEIEKDPPTMDWLRQCLWGGEGNYKDTRDEIENFYKALNG